MEEKMNEKMCRERNEAKKEHNERERELWEGARKRMQQERVRGKKRMQQEEMKEKERVIWRRRRCADIFPHLVTRFPQTPHIMTSSPLSPAPSDVIPLPRT